MNKCFNLCVILFCYIKHWQSYRENQRAKKNGKDGTEVSFTDIISSGM